MRMEYSFCHLTNLSRDLLSNILARLDGPCLAAVACTCFELQDMARDQNLWRELCHNTWPSTLLNETGHLPGGYRKFFAASYSMIFYDKSSNNTSPRLCQSQDVRYYASSSYIVSFVDIYHKDKCIFSRALEGIPDMDIPYNNENPSYCNRWLSSCPFRVHMLKYDYSADIDFGNELDENESDHGCYDNYTNNEQPFSSEVWVDQYRKLMDNFRLSWVLMDKRSHRIVNLSSWKPLTVQRNWPLEDEFTMQFGCVLLIEKGMLPENLAQCKILATCKISQSEADPTWREVSLRIEDMEGACVAVRTGLTVLQQAAYCRRSTNHTKIKAGIDNYERKKRQRKKRKELKDNLADIVCASIQGAIFLFFCYYYLLST